MPKRKRIASDSEETAESDAATTEKESDGLQIDVESVDDSGTPGTGERRRSKRRYIQVSPSTRTTRNQVNNTAAVTSQPPGLDSGTEAMVTDGEEKSETKDKNEAKEKPKDKKENRTKEEESEKDEKHDDKKEKEKLKIEKEKTNKEKPEKDKDEVASKEKEKVSPRGRVSKGRGGKRAEKEKCEATEEGKDDVMDSKKLLEMFGYERRAARVVAEASLKYSNDISACPLPGCDSKGHITGRHDTHRTLSACPLYHNMTVEECKSRQEKREAQTAAKRKILEKGASNSNAKRQVRHDVLALRKHCKEPHQNVKDKHSVHSDKYEQSREPLLTGLTSEFDLEMFRQAQAKACEELQYEMNSHYALTDKQEYRLQHIEMGKFDMNTWYSSPYPEEYARLPKLYVCEYCLKYMRTATILRRHAAKCVWRHPPGDEIYRKGNMSMFEVDGKKNKIYCQNLCLLAKLFLDHKTLYYDVEPFLFYVMTEADNHGCHMVGYFSKEKQSFLNYNVSCILTLPPFMRKGFGKMLIDFSYLLSKVEHKIGSPERPLSDLGLVSYRSYWKDVLLGYLHNYRNREVCIRDLSQETAVNANDIVSTLQALGMLKYWKGKHLVLKRQDLIDDYLRRRAARKPDARSIDPTGLKWTPPVNR